MDGLTAIDHGMETEAVLLCAFLKLREDLLKYAAAKVGIMAAEDIVQDAFVRLSLIQNQTLDEVESDSIANVKGYVFTIVRNLVLDFLRKQIKEVHRTVFQDSMPELHDSKPSAEDKMIHEEQLCQLKDAFDHLSGRRRQALEMHYEGFLLKEIASELGVSVSRAGQLVQCAIQECVKHLDKMESI